MQTLVKREWKVRRADTVYEVVEVQHVTIGKRTRKREVYCGYFSTIAAARDYIRFTFVDGGMN